jgi:hypothetical protein
MNSNYICLNQNFNNYFNLRVTAMKVLGIEIKGSDCILMLLEGNRNNFSQCEFPKKVSLANSYDSSDVRQFHAELTSLLKAHCIGRVAIKKRTEKGKFAGGAISFKMEGVIQLATDNDVLFISSSQIKALIKKGDINTPDINKYQEQAFYAAFNFLESE